MMDRSLRVLVVDPHEVVLLGLDALLTRQDWVESVFTAPSGDAARSLAARDEPHVAVVELAVGAESGPALSGDIQRASPTTQVLFMSGTGWISARAARAAGGCGFVSKGQPAAEIVAAIQAVGSGRTAFAAAPEAPRNALTPRERQVLGLLAGGDTNREIAAHLHLSTHTVKEHTSGLYRKLGVRNRAEAVQRAERLGLTG
jgi:DNA-binding NarL/FixJ family response regulator